MPCIKSSTVRKPRKKSFLVAVINRWWTACQPLDKPVCWIVVFCIDKHGFRFTWIVVFFGSPWRTCKFVLSLFFGVHKKGSFPRRTVPLVNTLSGPRPANPPCAQMRPARGISGFGIRQVEESKTCRINNQDRPQTNPEEAAHSGQRGEAGLGSSEGCGQASVQAEFVPHCISSLSIIVCKGSSSSGQCFLGAKACTCVIPRHLLHERGLQRQYGDCTITSSQERRALWVPVVDRGFCSSVILAKNGTTCYRPFIVFPKMV